MFEAKNINISTNIEEGYKMVAIADNEDDIKNYIILQRALHFDEQDKELGMATYYFEYNDQSYSGYGICKEVNLSDNLLKISLTNKEEISIILVGEYNEDILVDYLTDILNGIFKKK